MNKRSKHSLADLTIVIVSYRCADALHRCLASLQRDELCPRTRGERTRPEVIVVDSGSGDATPDVVARDYPGVLLIRHPVNVGFARGVNLGLRSMTRRDVLLLNPDAACPAETIADMLGYLRSLPRVAAVGPAIHGARGRPHVSTQRFPTFRTELSRQWERVAELTGRVDRGDEQPGQAGPVDWVSGACLLLRGEALQQVGVMDERYFLYFEETDWCRRAWALGWEVHYLPARRCMHEGGASARESGNRILGGRVAQHFRRSRRRYFRKHHGWSVALAVDGMHALRACALAMRGVFSRGWRQA